jgi:hypothetical protein
MKRILILAMMMLTGLTTINTFANNLCEEEMPSTGGPTKPLHRSPRISYINGYMDNGIYTFTFAKAFDNVEINVYHNDILVQQEVASFTVGQTYSIDLERYGEGEYTISVCENGNNIYYSVEKCDK